MMSLFLWTALKTTCTNSSLKIPRHGIMPHNKLATTPLPPPLFRGDHPHYDYSNMHTAFISLIDAFLHISIVQPLKKIASAQYQKWAAFALSAAAKTANTWIGQSGNGRDGQLS